MAPPPSEGGSHQPKNKRHRRNNHNKGGRGGGGRGGPRRPSFHGGQHNHLSNSHASPPTTTTGRKSPHNHFPLETRVVHAKRLGPSLPPLVITYTNEQNTVAEWLTQHVLLPSNIHPPFVGLDTETKPCFTREAALASKGPDTLQLALADGTCLVIHLSRMERLHDLQRLLASTGSVAEMLQPPAPSNPEHNEIATTTTTTTSIDGNQSHARLQGYVQLSRVLKSQQIAKVGVSIDDDALELLKNHLLETNCRLDLRTIDKDVEDNDDADDGGTRTGMNDGVARTNCQDDQKLPAINGTTKAANNGNSNDSTSNDSQQNRLPKSLKGLSEFYVQGMVLPKIKKLQMSNWAGHLSDAQIGYAAADAFAGAIVVATMDASAAHQHTKASLIDMVMEDEIDIVNLQEVRERRKQERKREQDKRRKDKKNKKQGGIKNSSSLKNQYPVNNQAPNSSNKADRNKHNNRNRKRRKLNPKGPREEASPLYAQLQTGLSSSR